MGFLHRASFVVLTSSLVLGACNAITGAENLVIGGDTDEGGSDGSGGKGSSGTAGTGGIPTTTGGVGAGGVITTSSTTPPPELVDAPGISITQIALYQGVKAVMMQNGAPTNNDVPIVAGRNALMRLWLSLDGNYDGQPITARLFIDGAASPIEIVAAPPGNPSDATLNSTFNFDIPGAAIPAGFSFRVELLQLDTGKGPNPAAHYPADGFAQTGAKNVGQTLKILLVPIRYAADGSNRLPDTQESMLKGYKDLFYSMYPVPEIELTVRNPVTYNGSISPNGSGWDNLLGSIGQLRANDNAPSDVYYYGIFKPSSSLNNFCGGGCVAGLGNIGGPGDPYSRAAIGLGYDDDGGATAWETAVHEIGHTHGRYHSPCGGAQGTEPNYPYSGGKTGVWGYSLLTKKLFNPQSYTDLMGYCNPIWVSDFTYKAFYNRIKAVNGANIIVPPELMNRVYDRVKIDANGDIHWMPSFKMTLPPEATPIELTVTSPTGTHTVIGQRYEYDHLPGGVILWPQTGGASSVVSAEIDGIVRILNK